MLVSDALKKHPGQAVRVYVTEAHSRTNVEKFAKSQGRKVTVKDTDHEYELVIE